MAETRQACSRLAAWSACAFVFATACATERGRPGQVRAENAHEAAILAESNARKFLSLIADTLSPVLEARILPAELAPNGRDLFFLPSSLSEAVRQTQDAKLFYFLESHLDNGHGGAINAAIVASLQDEDSPELPEDFELRLAQVERLDRQFIFKVGPKKCPEFDLTRNCNPGAAVGAGDIRFGKDPFGRAYYEELSSGRGLIRQENSFTERFVKSQLFTSRNASSRVSDRELAFFNGLLDKLRNSFDAQARQELLAVRVTSAEPNSVPSLLYAYAYEAPSSLPGEPRREPEIRVTPGLVRAFYAQCVAYAVNAEEIIRAWNDCPEEDPRRSFLASLRTSSDAIPERSKPPAQACRLARETSAATLNWQTQKFEECMNEAVAFIFAHELAHIRLKHEVSTPAQEKKADNEALRLLGTAKKGRQLAAASLLFRAIADNAGEYWGVSDSMAQALRDRWTAILGTENITQSAPE
jgi:hypothetical protein